MAITGVNGTRTNRTEHLPLATYLAEVEGFVVLKLDGPQGRRAVVFDREFGPEHVARFHHSREKRLLTRFKDLKLAACVAGLPTTT